MLQNSAFKSKRTAKEDQNQIFPLVCSDVYFFFYLYYAQKNELNDYTMNSHCVFLYTVYKLTGMFIACLLSSLFFSKVTFRSQ